MVELKYFGGLTVAETAEALQVALTLIGAEQNSQFCDGKELVGTT